MVQHDLRDLILKCYTSLSQIEIKYLYYYQFFIDKESNKLIGVFKSKN